MISVSMSASGPLKSRPEIIVISEGLSFESVSEEYTDSREWIRMNSRSGYTIVYLGTADINKWDELVKKYGMPNN